jgi:hypothetical protein
MPETAQSENVNGQASNKSAAAAAKQQYPRERLLENFLIFRLYPYSAAGLVLRTYKRPSKPVCGAGQPLKENRSSRYQRRQKTGRKLC